MLGAALLMIGRWALGMDMEVPWRTLLAFATKDYFSTKYTMSSGWWPFIIPTTIYKLFKRSTNASTDQQLSVNDSSQSTSQ